MVSQLQLPAVETVGTLEPVAHFDGAMPTGVTVSQQGRIRSIASGFWTRVVRYSNPQSTVDPSWYVWIWRAIVSSKPFSFHRMWHYPPLTLMMSGLI